jgi:hypothetical protein
MRGVARRRYSVGPLEQCLRAQGYTDCYNEIDAEVCATLSCDEECDSPSTRYIGLIKGDSYRAISHCPKCDLEVEF